MNPVGRSILFGTLALLIAALALPNGGLSAEQDYFLATASRGGTYYPVGVALASLTQARLKPAHGIGMEAINSAGSDENIQLLRDGEAQFAIVQGLFGHYAWHGKGPIADQGSQKWLRAITALWQNVEQFTIRSKYVETGTIADLVSLRGKQIALGTKNSGTLASNRVLLGNLGLDIDRDFHLVHLSYGPSADALHNGRVVAMGTPAGVPTGSVTWIKSALGSEATLLSFTAEQARKADGGLGLWTPYTIPAHTYPGQDQPIETIAQPNILVVREDVDEDAVYQITKAIYENLSFLQSMHDATNTMDIQKALIGLPIPLHPGALRYFREVGLPVPDKLVPK